MTREEAINFLLGVGGRNLEPGSAVALEIAQLLKDSVPVAASPALKATGTDNEILHYLDTTSRVSCPQITCEQAAGIAALLRKANSYEDCGQDGVCAISPGCNRHFLDFNRELAVRLTDKQSLQEACGFAWDCGREIAATQSEASINSLGLARDLKNCRAAATALADALDKSHETENVACGFAWDCGREISDQIWVAEQLRKSMGFGVVVSTGDIDPGIYEGTGSGFKFGATKGVKR